MHIPEGGGDLQGKLAIKFVYNLNHHIDHHWRSKSCGEMVNTMDIFRENRRKKAAESILLDLKREDAPSLVRKWWGTSAWSMFRETRVSDLPDETINAVIQTISDHSGRPEVAQPLVQVLEGLLKRSRQVDTIEVLNTRLSDKTSVFYLYHQLICMASSDQHIPFLLDVLRSSFFVKEIKTREEQLTETGTRDVYSPGNRYEDDDYNSVEITLTYTAITNYQSHHMFFAELAKSRLKEITKSISDHNLARKISEAITEFKRSRPKDKVLLISRRYDDDD